MRTRQNFSEISLFISGRLLPSVYLFIFMLIVGWASAQDITDRLHKPWEVGTFMSQSFQANRVDFPQKQFLPGIGSMEKQWDRVYPALLFSYRRQATDGSDVWLVLSLGYQRNAFLYRQEKQAESLGVAFQETEARTDLHNLFFSLGLNFNVYNHGSHSFHLRPHLGYMINAANELDIIREQQLGIDSSFRRLRFHSRTGRWDGDIEDFTDNDFFMLGVQAAYERSFGKTGVRGYVEVARLIGQLVNDYDSERIFNSNLTLGLAFLF